eukprot:tig00020553_g10520.t1
MLDAMQPSRNLFEFYASKLTSPYAPLVEIFENALRTDGTLCSVDVARCGASSIAVRDASGGLSMDRATKPLLRTFHGSPSEERKTSTYSRHGMGLKMAAYALGSTATVLLAARRTEAGVEFNGRLYHSDANGSFRVVEYDPVHTAVVGADVCLSPRGNLGADLCILAYRAATDPDCADLVDCGYAEKVRAEILGAVNSELAKLASLVAGSECGGGTTVIFANHPGRSVRWSDAVSDFVPRWSLAKDTLGIPFCATLSEHLACAYPTIDGIRRPDLRATVAGRPVAFRRIEDMLSGRVTTFRDVYHGSPSFSATVFCGRAAEGGPYAAAPFYFKGGRALVLWMGRVLTSIDVPIPKLMALPRLGFVVCIDGELDAHSDFPKDQLHGNDEKRIVEMLDQLFR